MIDRTTIIVSKKTRDKLKEIGKKGESYNLIIEKLLKLKCSADV